MLLKTRKKSKLIPPTGGFTFVEISVVIAIIGILAGIIFVSLTSARVKAHDAKRVASLQEMAKAIISLDTPYSNNALTGCNQANTVGSTADGGSTNNVVTCTGTNTYPNSLNFSNYLDPVAPAGANADSGTCHNSNEAIVPCQYGIFRDDGQTSISPVTTENFEICTVLETGDKGYGGTTADNAIVHVGTDTTGAVRTGCN